MKSIFLAQWMKDKRSPLLVIAFTMLSIVATLLFGSSANSKMNVHVFPETGLDASTFEVWVDLLNDNDTLEFVRVDEGEARKDVNGGRVDAAIQISDESYRLIAAIDRPNIQLVEQHVRQVFVDELQLRLVAGYTSDEMSYREALQSYLEEPPLSIQALATDGSPLISYSMNNQLLITFTLFLVIFTIGYKINAITVEKVSGIWNRIVLSPVKKIEMYMGHLLYCSIIGFTQISIILLLFRYLFQYNLGQRMEMLLIIAAIYTVTIVSFSMLLTGLLRTPEQFNMVFPSIIPIMPLLSGAYMPPGTITNDVLLAIAELFPLKHALDAMIAISMYGAGWSELFLPISKLLLIGVLCMGIGINLMERRKDGYR